MLFIGKNLIEIDECDSTNTLAAKMLRELVLPEGTAIMTKRQNFGKGQRGNIWESEFEKNITLSIILKPTFLDVDDQFNLNMIVSNAIRKLCAHLSCVDVKVKWPNDILISQKKISGILIENSISKSKLKHSIIGIGLNVNQEKFSFDTATSLKNELNDEFDLKLISENLFSFLEAEYLKLKAGKFNEIKAEYLDYLHGINKLQIYKDKEGELLEGQIVGIENSGKLKMIVEGKEKLFGMKEVSFNL